MEQKYINNQTIIQYIVFVWDQQMLENCMQVDLYVWMGDKNTISS